MRKCLLVVLCLLIIGPFNLNLDHPTSLVAGDYTVYSLSTIVVYSEESMDSPVAESVGFFPSSTQIHTLGDDVVAPGGVYIHIDEPIRGYIWWGNVEDISITMH